jgi:hypothetical protein
MRRSIPCLPVARMVQGEKGVLRPRGAALRVGRENESMV